jgi:hypothetical protein
MSRQWIVVAVTGVAVLCAASPAPTQQCPNLMDRMAVQYWPSRADRIEVAGPHVVLSAFRDHKVCDGYLAVVDVTDRRAPRALGEPRSACVVDLAVSGDHVLYLARRSRTSSDFTGLYIADISDPADPVLLLLYQPLGPLPRQIAVDGAFAYVATSAGLTVLDVGEGSPAVPVGFFASTWEPSDLVVRGGFAYVTIPHVGLHVFDLSNPAYPARVGVWEADWNAHDLDVSGGFAYVADGEDGVRVLDVSTPGAPSEVSVLQAPGAVSRISVSGSVALAVTDGSGVWVADLSDPFTPWWFGQVPTEGPAVAAAMADGTAYVSEGPGAVRSDYGRFRIVDLSEPRSPADRASFEYRSTPSDLAAVDGVVYAATGDTGLFLGVVGAVGLSRTAFLDTPGFASGVAVHGDLVLVADGTAGMRVVDVSDVSGPVEVGALDTPGEARRIATRGEVAFVADGEAGLRIVDLSTPQHPVEVSSIDTGGPALDVAVAGDYVYVATGEQLLVIQAADPHRPFDAYQTADVRATCVEARQGYLYACSGDLVSIFDISIPYFQWNPQPRGTVPIEGLDDLAVSGHFVYSAGREGLQVVGVVNPQGPKTMGQWTVPGDADIGLRAVAIADGRTYLGTDAEVLVLDNRCLTTTWVPIVAHCDGAHDSKWRSDVIITHGAEVTVPVELVLHTPEGARSLETAVEVGHQAVFEDVVGLFDHEGTCALEIRADTPLNIVSSMYNANDGGTSGAYFQGHRSCDCLQGTAWFYGLRQEEGLYRTNLSFTHTGKAARGYARVTLYRSDGEELVSYPVYLDPGRVVQDLQPFKDRAGAPNVGWGFAKVTVHDGPMLVTATVIDSRTDHPMMVPMTR